MRYTKKAKNAERLGLRFPISFLQMKDELSAKVTIFLKTSNTCASLYHSKSLNTKLTKFDGVILEVRGKKESLPEFVDVVDGSKFFKKVG